MMNKTNEDPEESMKTWVYGKGEKGWYVARWTWNQEYADHLTSLGLKVQRSIEKPSKAA